MGGGIDQSSSLTPALPLPNNQLGVCRNAPQCVQAEPDYQVVFLRFTAFTSATLPTAVTLYVLRHCHIE